MITIYSNLAEQEKRRIRTHLRQVLKLNRQEIEENYKLYIKPLEDREKAIKDFLKNKVCLESMKARLKQINTYIQKSI